MLTEPFKLTKVHSVSTFNLFQMLKPIRLLTKFVFIVPEWAHHPHSVHKSTSEVILLILSALLLAIEISDIFYGFAAFVYFASEMEEMVKTITPLLWILWNGIPCTCHLFLLYNLNRLRSFLNLLKKFTTSNTLLQQYPVPFRKKSIIALYASLLCFQCYTAAVFITYMLSYPENPPLLTSFAFFRSGAAWYLAIITEAFSAIYAVVGLIMVDLGIGLIFYYIGLWWRSLSLFVQDLSLNQEEMTNNIAGISKLWQTYEEILYILDKAEALFGILILGNQLNHLLATTLFIYVRIRKTKAEGWTSVAFLINLLITCYRTAVYNILLSQVYQEHQKFQDQLARCVATQNTGECGPSAHYVKLRDLLIRAHFRVVAVSPCQLYTITPSTLLTIVTTVVAYLVILLQSK